MTDEERAGRGPKGGMGRLAESTRQIIELLPRTTVPTETVGRAADLIEEAARLIGEGVPEWKPKFPTSPGEYASEGFFPFSPMVGVFNPMAPPVKFEFLADGIRGTARFGIAYQGPPGCVHGGVIAEFFDELLGAVNMAAGNGGLTAKLTVRYRSTTPLYTDLTFEAQSLTPSGRTVHAKASLWAGDRLCADAEGVFVMVDREKFEEITTGSHPASQEG